VGERCSSPCDLCGEGCCCSGSAPSSGGHHRKHLARPSSGLSARFHPGAQEGNRVALSIGISEPLSSFLPQGMVPSQVVPNVPTAGLSGCTNSVCRRTQCGVFKEFSRSAAWSLCWHNVVIFNLIICYNKYCSKMRKAGNIQQPEASCRKDKRSTH